MQNHVPPSFPRAASNCGDAGPRRAGAQAQQGAQRRAVQRAALQAAGCTTIRAETVPGRAATAAASCRPRRKFLCPGDTLTVTRIDRLARSLRDLQNLVHELREKGVHLKATEQSIDTNSAAGTAFLSMLGVAAEFENNSRRERQMEGIKAAKARGVYRGQKPTIKPEEVRRLRKDGLGATAIARKLGVGRASVYRALQS